MTAVCLCMCVVMSGELYSETQKECSAYKQRNDELVRQLSSVMRRTLSPTEHDVQQPTLDISNRQTETETAAGKHGGHDGDVQSSSWLLDFTEEKQNVHRETGTDASLSSPSFVNINSSSTDDSSHGVTRTQVSVNH